MDCKNKEKLPTSCIDPEMKYCQECKYGHNIYPADVETTSDLEGCCFETFCSLGFDNIKEEEE